MKATSSIFRTKPVSNLGFATHLLISALAVMITAMPAKSWAQPKVEEHYYVINLDGQRSGWMHETSIIDDETMTSKAEVHFEIKRGKMKIAITMESEFVETLDHNPISMISTQSMASMPITTSVKFLEDKLEVEITQNGSTNMQTQPLPEGTWLTPGGAEKYFNLRRAAGAEEISIRTLDPMSGIAPTISTYTNFQDETIEVYGRDVPSTRATLTNSASPGLTSFENFDSKGRMLKSITQLGGINMEVLAADKALAMAELDPPELMQSTFVTPKGSIRRPRRVENGRYVLRLPQAKLADLPVLPSQTFERIDDHTLRLSVTMGDIETSEDRPGNEFIEASTMVDKDDPVIRQLVTSSRPSEDAPDEIRAEAMRRAVYSHIDEKHLGVGIATASEVARTGVGDCTEHATLLAAMLRADDIPSRTVSGLVFVNSFEDSKDIFGYHMWTQGWIAEDGKGMWVDLDATLGPRTRFDATHIALSVSALSDGESNNAMIALVPLLGALEIEIEETQ
jgi:hypothetical protein